MPRKPKYIAYLHGISEALLYCWLTGLVLPHANALYNLGLFGAPLVGLAYVLLSRGSALTWPPKALTFGFCAFSAWSLLSCLWAPLPKQAIVQWWGNPGIAVMTGCIYAVIFQDRGSQKRFWQFIVPLSAVLAYMYIAEWISVSKAAGALIPPYPSMRYWGDRLILCIPFLMFSGEVADKRIVKSVIKSLVLIFACLMIVTGARGVWLALIFYIISWAILTNKGKQIAVIVVTLCLIFGLSLLIPENPLKQRLSNITYMSDRLNYTWGPALQFWKQSPFAGIGFGSDAFQEKANELAKNNTDWLTEIDQGDQDHYVHLGPHSNYLEALAGGGVIGLFLLLYFYSQVIWNTFLLPRPINLLLAATGSGIFVKYMIHGTVESINWKALGILIGLMLAALASNPRSKNKEK